MQCVFGCTWLNVYQPNTHIYTHEQIFKCILLVCNFQINDMILILYHYIFRFCFSIFFFLSYTLYFVSATPGAAVCIWLWIKVLCFVFAKNGFSDGVSIKCVCSRNLFNHLKFNRLFGSSRISIVITLNLNSISIKLKIWSFIQIVFQFEFVLFFWLIKGAFISEFTKGALGSAFIEDAPDS